MDRKALQYSNGLNHPDSGERLKNLGKLMGEVQRGKIQRFEEGTYVNNHIHTIYSFSPYSPSKAVWMAYKAGLATAGIMDHDSISGGEEFIKAGSIAGIATTIGVECRVDFSQTPLRGMRINNPDQKSIGYVAMHGIPHTRINTVKKFFAPYNRERNKRNKKMVERLNGMLSSFGIHIDFHRDVVPISSSREGGSITERHILFSLSRKLIERYGKGEALVGFLKKDLGMNIKPSLESLLLDSTNRFYEYDLLGVLKSELVSVFYIDAESECPDVREFTAFSEEIGAISAYAYLGDVVHSVTGDKRSQKFEDDYLDLLFEVLKDLGFHAVTYMPSRNTLKQIKRVRDLCHHYDFFQISGEDINSPRQSFVCNLLNLDEFKHLVDAAWALVGHEREATLDIRRGMFAPETIQKYPDLYERIQIYKAIGQK